MADENEKRPYSAPRIEEYGTLAGLTSGNTVGEPDSAGAGSQNS
jgi:hypothetical protein